MKWLAAAIAIVLLAAVAVLTANGSDKGDAQTPKPPPAAYTRTCQGTNTYPAYPASKRDALLGRVRIGAFRGNFENAKAEDVYSPKPGRKALKAPVVFPGRRDVTIAVPESHRAVLRLQFKSNRSAGHPSVRFRSCSRSRDTVTGYAGALLYTGPWPACVPVDVTVTGSRTTRHLLSLGAGRCEDRG